MLNTSYPYMQSSANQFIEMLSGIIEVYTGAVVVIGVLLLVLLVWLCASELHQLKQVKRAKHQPQTHRPRNVARRNGVRGVLEESSIQPSTVA